MRIYILLLLLLSTQAHAAIAPVVFISIVAPRVAELPYVIDEPARSEIIAARNLAYEEIQKVGYQNSVLYRQFLSDLRTWFADSNLDRDTYFLDARCGILFSRDQEREGIINFYANRTQCER